MTPMRTSRPRPFAFRPAAGVGAAWAVLAAIGGIAPPPAAAQPSITLNIGWFMVTDVDSRVANDVLLENLNDFAFRVDDFDGPTVGGSLDIPLGEYLEASFGLGYYQRTVPSTYREFLVDQDFRLRVIPGTAVIRVLPFGRSPVQPYFGAGGGLYAWRYAEFGDFVDADELVFTDRFVAKGTAVGRVLIGGVRFPFGDGFSIGGELQYHDASGDLGRDSGFLQDGIDVGGLSTQLTFQVTF